MSALIWGKTATWAACRGLRATGTGRDKGGKKKLRGQYNVPICHVQGLQLSIFIWSRWRRWVIHCLSESLKGKKTMAWKKLKRWKTPLPESHCEWPHWVCPWVCSWCYSGKKSTSYMGCRWAFLRLRRKQSGAVVPFWSGWRSFRDQVRKSEMWMPKNLKLDTHSTTALLMYMGACACLLARLKSTMIYLGLVGLKGQAVVGTPRARCWTSSL